MKLYFLRHGVAVEPEEWDGAEVDRPLSAAGEAALAGAVLLLRAAGISPEALLTSPLVRARRTAAIVAEGLGLTARVEVAPLLAPGFDTGRLTEVLKPRSGVESLLLVGHEPDLGETVGELIGGSRVEMKKGALACVVLKDPKELRGYLAWLVPPRFQPHS